MLKIVHMKVNGKEVELAVDERESLLDTLRQRLGLTSSIRFLSWLSFTRTAQPRVAISMAFLLPYLM